MSAAAEAMTIVVGASRVMPAQAPAELTDAQADVWRRVVGSMPGNFMTKAAHPILIEYCRHVCRARLLEQQIAGFEMEWAKAEGGLERLDRLFSMADRETRTITACARALRLTPQSQIDAAKAGRGVANRVDGPKPWD